LFYQNIIVLKTTHPITMRKLKLIWDFRGPEALKTAEHHVIHLKEYSERQSNNVYAIDHEVINEVHVIAFMVIDEEDKIYFRDSLKPHRGEWMDS